MLRSVTQRCATNMQTVPLTAAITSPVCSVATVATWPHSAAPVALAPMMAIWNIDMPRARTQSGSASCADTLSELALVIQAMPLSSIAGIATYRFGAKAITAIDADCSSMARITSTSRGIAWRSRGRYIAATMAPEPIAASSMVNALASPPSRLRATSGSSASSAVE